MIGGGLKWPWWLSLRLHRLETCATIWLQFGIIRGRADKPVGSISGPRRKGFFRSLNVIYSQDNPCGQAHRGTAPVV